MGRVRCKPEIGVELSLLGDLGKPCSHTFCDVLQVPMVSLGTCVFPTTWLRRAKSSLPLPVSQGSKPGSRDPTREGMGVGMARGLGNMSSHPPGPSARFVSTHWDCEETPLGTQGTGDTFCAS